MASGKIDVHGSLVEVLTDESDPIRPLVTQDGVLQLILGSAGMRDTELVQRWRGVLFFNNQTRFEFEPQPYVDEAGEEQCGYKLQDVIMLLYETAEWIRPQAMFVDQSNRVRNIIAALAVVGFLTVIQDVTGGRTLVPPSSG